MKLFNYQKVVRLLLILLVTFFFFLMFFLSYANLSLFLNKERDNEEKDKKNDGDSPEDDEDENNPEWDQKQLEFLKKVIGDLIQETVLKYSLDFNLRDELVFQPDFFEYLFFSQIFKTMLPFKVNSFKFQYDEKLRFVKVSYFDAEKKLFLDWNFSLFEKKETLT